MNPLDAFLDEFGGATKVANNPSSTWRSLGAAGGNALAQGLGAGVGAAMLAGGAMAVQHLYDAATSKRDFRSMMDAHKDLHHEDQRSVLQAFKTLRSFAPDMSKDPLVSGAMVRQMVQSPTGVAGHVQEALLAQKNIGTPAMTAFLTAGTRSTQEGMRHLTPFTPSVHPDLLQERDEALAREQSFHARREKEQDEAYARQQQFHGRQLQQLRDELHEEQHAGRAKAHAAGAQFGIRQMQNPPRTQQRVLPLGAEAFRLSKVPNPKVTRKADEP